MCKHNWIKSYLCACELLDNGIGFKYHMVTWLFVVWSHSKYFKFWGERFILNKNDLIQGDLSAILRIHVLKIVPLVHMSVSLSHTLACTSHDSVSGTSLVKKRRDFFEICPCFNTPHNTDVWYINGSWFINHGRCFMVIIIDWSYFVFSNIG